MKEKIILISIQFFLVVNVLLYVFDNAYTYILNKVFYSAGALTTGVYNSAYILNSNDFLFKHELLPLSLSIFLIGFIGFLESKEFLSVLINTEIIMLGLNFYLITNSLLWGDFLGQVFALCFLAVTAAETAIGLGLLILLYRAKGKVSFMEYSVLKG